MTEWVRGNDFFGHVINLNFDKQGEAHKTLFGGVYSLFIKVFLVVYLYLNLAKLFTHVDDNNVTTVGALNLELVGDVSVVDDSSMLVFFVVSK